ncbi:flagellar type III secretion system pore protein FliP [Opitutales bacterium ASA1]|uniref:flagellar type III secretion system pore protein FliP n=1 Tax=Congregicoccus parvus TaxID=3081749 RepID=UPI002B2E2803|nr:flagellar type III secretion system pore protein FliP [Opitutales bacterium ASA1]
MRKLWIHSSAAFLVAAVEASAQGAPGQVSITLGGGEGVAPDLSVAIQVLILMTLLTLGPSLVILMSSFTRIVIVLGFVRTAMGVQQAPSNQIIVGLGLILSFFVMQPVFSRMHTEAIQPYLAKEITSVEALERGGEPLKQFMLKQTRVSDLEFFLELSNSGPTLAEELPFRIIAPAFVMSELRSAFQMGFLVFLPFIVIDFLVATTLMSMGMMMMPPVVVSLPFKLLLFVLVDGWSLVVRSLVQSFHV